tara:strand:+ start:264 stop:1031 length:768 start_codon:yes stop_codon:yes gene_type:complete
LKKKKIIKYICSLSVSFIILTHSGTLLDKTAKAFFEDQIKYNFMYHWYPMLNDSSPEKRFKAARSFLAYPEWSLPLLRSIIMNTDSGNVSWQIAMLMGMLGDSTDVPPLLKIWRELKVDEKTSVWLGSMRRLYWKTRGPEPALPILENLSFNFAENSEENGVEAIEIKLFFRIRNAAKNPLFIRVSANFWQTITDETTPTKYFWIPADSHIKSNIKTNIFAVSHSDKVRLDFRIWEIGVSEPILHKSGEILFPVK